MAYITHLFTENICSTSSQQTTRKREINNRVLFLSQLLFSIVEILLRDVYCLLSA